MLSKLTNREKVLIYILLCFVIVVGGIVLLIMPASDRFVAAAERYDNSEIEAKNVRTIIEAEDRNQLNLETTNKDIKKLHNFYQNTLRNEEIDVLLTGLINSSGMTPKRLLINGSSTGTDGETTGSDATVNNDGTGNETINSTNTTEGKATENGTDSKGSLALKKDIVLITASGTYSQIKSFADKVDKAKGVVIKKLSFQSESMTQTTLSETLINTDGDVKTASNGDISVEFTIEVYQVK